MLYKLFKKICTNELLAALIMVGIVGSCALGIASAINNPFFEDVSTIIWSMNVAYLVGFVINFFIILFIVMGMDDKKWPVFGKGFLNTMIYVTIFGYSYVNLMVSGVLILLFVIATITYLPKIIPSGNNWFDLADVMKRNFHK